MIVLYRVLTLIVYPLFFIFTWIRIFLKKEDKQRYKERLLSSHFKPSRDVSKKLIWFHAASIGEFKSIVPIVKTLKKNNKRMEILITTTTLSSSNLVINEFKKMENIYHRFFPYDVEFLIRKFLDQWKPDRIFFIDSEIWPNLILIANQKKIPLALLNARITLKTFKRWSKFRNTSKMIFSKFNICLASNLSSEKFLKELGAKNISFLGNIKFIQEIDETTINSINSKMLKNKRFWVAASTHNGEEIFCLKAHEIIKKSYHDIVTIIAPRHINRGKKIKSYCDRLSLNSQLLNQGEKILKDKEVIIINSYGVLKEYFKYAKSVFIGKSIIPKLKDDGGQNPLDAANLKCRIYHGPYVYNFEEIYEILENQKITKKISTYEELSRCLIEDLKKTEKDESKTINNLNEFNKKIFNNTMVVVEKFVL